MPQSLLEELVSVVNVKRPAFMTDFLRPFQINYVAIEADDTWMGTFLWSKLAPFNVALFLLISSIYFFVRASKAEGATQSAFHDGAWVCVSSAVFIFAAYFVLVARQRFYQNI